MSIEQLFANGNKPNILIIITDQERALSEWPESYRTTLGGKLAAMNRLMANGLAFNHAYTAASMCSPSRAAFQTSQYPFNLNCTKTGQAVLPLPDGTNANLASVLLAAGYTTYWIGKWHLLGSNEPGSGSGDLLPWGYQAYGPPGPPGGNELAWDPPDAGLTLSSASLGGGTIGKKQNNRNDQRYLANAIEFLTGPPAEPWCLVVSLVNPHDVHLGYQGVAHKFYKRSAYEKQGVPLPHTVYQDIDTMPRGQSDYTWKGKKGTGAQRRHFGDFYSYLVQYVDGQIGSILDALSPTQIDNTLIIRFADHGEMGLAHGLVEKFVNAYSQCVHIPLVFSNPVAWPSATVTDALASSVDLVPTLANLLNVSNSTWQFVGTSLMPVLLDPTMSVQEFVHFTYDDWGKAGDPCVIRGIRSQQWAYAVYLDSVASETSGFSDADWEMYDLTKDPEERVNLAGQGLNEQIVLDWCLQVAMITKGTAPKWYGTFPGKNWPPQKTSASIGGPPPTWSQRAARPLAKLPGITKAQVEALRYVGVRDTAALLARAASAPGRQALANLASASPRQIDNWVKDTKRLLQQRPPMPAKPRPRPAPPKRRGRAGSRAR